MYLADQGSKVLKTLKILVLTLFSVSILIACDEGTNDSNDDSNDDSEQIEDLPFLETLGVNTDIGERQDHTGSNNLPDSFRPLGQSHYLYKPAEFYALGFQTGNSGPAMSLNKFVDSSVDINFDGYVEGHNTLGSIVDFWSDVEFPAATAFRREGSGKEDMMLIYVNPSEQLIAKVFSYDEVGDSINVETVMTTSAYTVNELNIESVDFNGDGIDEFVIAITDDAEGKVALYQATLAGNGLTMALVTEIDSQLADTHINVEFASGNIDYDAGEEWGLTVNVDPNQTFTVGDDTSTQFYLFDDSINNFANLDEGLVIANNSFVARVAGIAFADIDSDGLDEIVVAGNSNIRPDPNNAFYDYIVRVLDDKEHGFSELGNKRVIDSQVGASGISSSSMNYVFVKPINVDYLPNDTASMAEEVLINNILLDDIVEKDCTGDCLDLSLHDMTVILYPDQQSFFRYRTASVMVGDFNADSRDDALYFSFASNGESHELSGLSDTNGDGSLELNPTFVTEIDLDQGGNGIPLLVPLNANHDSVHVKAESTVEPALFFTEPMMVAVMAAAPCSESLGQNTDDCITSYGTEKSNSDETETGTTVKTATSVGIEVEAEFFGVGATASVERTVARSASRSLTETYSYSESITYNSGGVEDLVVFTTVPFDEYVYTITQHPDEDMIGKPVSIRLPRTPITVSTERSFYNEHRDEGAIEIGSEIFQHTPGDWTTYQRNTDKNTLMSLYDGVQSSSAVSVGQGTGSTEIELVISEEYANAWGSAEEVEISIAGKLGVVTGGYANETSTERAITISRGTAKIYSGSVANMDAESFGDSSNRYRYGLFNYQYTDSESGQTFEVIDYWVEQ